MLISMDKVIFGKRVRDEYGDMQSLVDSIKKYGLLHPIVIDNEYRLVAGGRRFLACERVGMKEIEAKMLGHLTEKELRVLELEENLKRKDLTSYEKSKNLVELAEIKEDELREIQHNTVDLDMPETKINEHCFISDIEEEGRDKKQFRTESVRNSRRPLEPSSFGSLAALVGVPKQTFADAKVHVLAIEKYPNLKEMPKYRAIEEAKKLDRVVDLVQQKNKIKQENENKEANFNTYLADCKKVAKQINDALYAVLLLDCGNEGLNKFDKLLDEGLRKTYLDVVKQDIVKLITIEKKLKGVKK